MAKKKEPIWIAREFPKCSACRKCEIACSLAHENRIWPEASRVRVFMLVPGLEFPHLCAQCEDYPCVESCPFKALSISKRTGAVLVDAKNAPHAENV
jgi:Fe-S-cluster-containing hydrogenase component 2